MTVTSVDGISAYDTMSRVAVMNGLAGVDPGVLPFVRLFYGSSSRYLWEDDPGVTHTITQGNAIAVFTGQHQASVARSARTVEGGSLMAFLDDIYLVTPLTRVGAVHTNLSAELQKRCHSKREGPECGTQPVCAQLRAIGWFASQF